MKKLPSAVFVLTALGLVFVASEAQSACEDVPAPPLGFQYEDEAGKEYAACEAARAKLKLPEVKLPRIRALRMHLEAIRNFTYKEDAPGGDVWDVFDISKPFVGDCEDFAFSMQRAVGAGSVYLVLTKDADPDVLADHAVFVFGGVVWDMEDNYTIRGYEALGHRILFRVGDATPEIK